MNEPPRRLIRTPRDAEEVACDWLRHWGHPEAVVTPTGADEGIDVVGADIVVQVKAEAKLTSRPVVQALAGVAAVEGKRGVFFSLGGYTAEAVAWAERARIALFTFDLSGEPTPANDLARGVAAAPGEVWARSLPEPWAQPPPQQDLNAQPLVPGDSLDTARVAATLLVTDAAPKALGGTYPHLWTVEREHQLLWFIEKAELPDGSLGGRLGVHYLALPQWRHGKPPAPLPPEMTAWAGTSEEWAQLDRSHLSPRERAKAEADERALWVREVKGAPLVLSYAPQDEPQLAVQMAADLSAVLLTLGVNPEATVVCRGEFGRLLDEDHDATEQEFGEAPLLHEDSPGQPAYHPDNPAGHKHSRETLPSRG
jgi:hypothetical protein